MHLSYLNRRKKLLGIFTNLFVRIQHKGGIIYFYYAIHFILFFNDMSSSNLFYKLLLLYLRRIMAKDKTLEGSIGN
jgi:hypothetical protein